MIEAAAVLSALVRHWADFFIISVLLFANAVVGFWEEFAAGNAIAALKKTLALKARVSRDGNWTTLPRANLSPAIWFACAWATLCRPTRCSMQAIRRSRPIGAHRRIASGPTQDWRHGLFELDPEMGDIDALVSATGNNTYFGKTAALVESAQTASHFQRAVLKIGDYLIVIAIALVVLILTVALFRGDPFMTTLQFALVLTVAAIPVAMPTVLSVTMAVGARLLARKQAIVSRLVAIEELAGVDILCSDKTGTLTQNKLTLGDAFCAEGISAVDVILAASLASRAENQDSIDLAVLGGLKDKDALRGFQVTHFQPFDPVHKRTEADVKDADGKSFKVTKGAPQVILALVANRNAVQEAVAKAVDDFAQRGFRSLGVARTDADGRMEVSRRFAAVRSAARGFGGNDQDRERNGCRGEDGHRRPACDRKGNCKAGRTRHELDRRIRFR